MRKILSKSAAASVYQAMFALKAVGGRLGTVAIPMGGGIETLDKEFTTGAVHVESEYPGENNCGRKWAEKYPSRAAFAAAYDIAALAPATPAATAA